MRLHSRHRSLDLSQPAVMGILNVTPDSFSDGGSHAALEPALERARQMIAEGAAIIDVGGESTRPQAAPVPEAEELERTIPVIEALRREYDGFISIDTMKPAVMRAACAAGADLVNDVTALAAPQALEAVLESGAAVCLMHMQGEPRTMQVNPVYSDVVGEVHRFLLQRVRACTAAGITRERIVLDPGFGFGKRLEHNLELLGRLDEFADLGCPLLAGLSRKSMFQQLLGLPVQERLHAGVAAASLAVWQGAAIVRAHDVRETVQAIRLAAAVRKHRGRA